MHIISNVFVEKNIHMQYLVINHCKKLCFLPHCRLQIPIDRLASTHVDSNIYKYLPNMIPHKTSKSDVVEHGYERRRLICNNSLLARVRDLDIDPCSRHLGIIVAHIHSVYSV